MTTSSRDRETEENERRERKFLAMRRDEHASPLVGERATASDEPVAMCTRGKRSDLRATDTTAPAQHSLNDDR